MNELEVQATRSFSCVLGNFTRGRRYRLDTQEPSVKGLIEGGFLKITRGNPIADVRVDFDAADRAAMNKLLGLSDTNVQAPQWQEEPEASHGEGEAESGADSAPEPSSGDTAGIPNGRSGSKRRKSPGAQG